MRRERAKVRDVATEHDACRFCTGHDDGVNGGPAPCQMTELTRATNERNRKILPDVAGLEKSIHRCVIALAARRRLDENDRRDQRRPLSVADERADYSNRILVSLREESHSA